LEEENENDDGEREGEEGAIASFDDKEQGEAIGAARETEAPEEAREARQGQGSGRCSQESSRARRGGPSLHSHSPSLK